MIRFAAILILVSAYFSPAHALSVDLWQEIERDVLDLVNQDRANLGLGALTGDSRLHDAARAHSLDMQTNNFVDHAGTGGTTPGQRAQAAGYDWNRVGENIAAGYLTAESVVTAWLNSPGHRDNMRDGLFTDAGIALIEGGPNNTFETYWTLVLAAGDSATGQPIVALPPIPGVPGPGQPAQPVQAPEPLQVAQVPLPPAFWLFAAALAAGLLTQRRRGKVA